MSNLLKGILVGLLVIAVGAYWFPNTNQSSTIAGTSAAGSNFGTAKFAGVTVNLAAPGANATSSSVYNSDAYDRYVTVMRYACQGIGTSKTAYSGTGLIYLAVTAATSSTAAPSSNGNTNSIGVGSTIISTSTTQYTIASTTSNSTNIAIIWAPGSYMTFTTNATNTAACTFGVDYIGS